MIDPGHGGEDPGARGRKTHEKNVVLEIARRLKKRIDAREGMRAELTRTGDYYVNLRRRSALARQKRADLFISIHADAFTSPSARGASVYALSLRGATSESARLLANRENLSDLAGGVNLAEKDALLAEVLLDLSMSNTVSESLRFGAEVLDELKKIGRVHSRRVEQAGFVVLKSPDVPSILVETAYITNPGEEKLLRSAKHQKRLANAIMAGVERYLAKNPSYYARN
jgi:N-acetylmuramoyl-L-alanine amidase